MSDEHFVRVGALGRVGRFVAHDARKIPRGASVICRTARGLEVGDVVAPAALPAGRGQADGILLRTLAPGDELWLTRLRRYRQESVAACEELLRQAGCPDVLVDVEPLFDGQTIYFYFLRPPTPRAEELTQALAEAYESRARLREFTEAVAMGCGPGCGSEDAPGCSRGGCATCAIVGACRPA